MDKLYQTRTERFANGRTVRNLFEEAVVAASKRISHMGIASREDLSILKMEDFGIV